MTGPDDRSQSDAGSVDERRSARTAPLDARPEDIVGCSGPLWRDYRVIGPHSTAWNELRHDGPLQGMRWDPQPLPFRSRQSAGVLYAASDMLTALAEVYQGERVIRRTPGREIAAWLPRRPLELLDVTDLFLVRNGGFASVAYRQKAVTREWARRIFTELGDRIDGIQYRSAVTNRPTYALYNRAADSFPSRPSLQRPLTSSSLNSDLARAAAELNYGLRVIAKRVTTTLSTPPRASDQTGKGLEEVRLRPLPFTQTRCVIMPSGLRRARTWSASARGRAP